MPACTRQIVLVVVVVNSSRPSSPCTTSTLDAPRGEHPGHHLGEISERAADQPGPRLSRIRKRPKQIEDRRHPDLAAHRRRVPVGRVEQRREAEPDPDFGQAARDLVGPEVDAHPERLERVGAAGQRGRRAVAVFDHRHPRGRDHDRRHRRQVDRVDAVATGADDVDGVVADRVGGYPARVAEHHVGQLADFGRGGRLHLHRDREGGDLGRRRLAGHDLVHRPGGLAPRQVLPVGQTAQDLRPRRRRPGHSRGKRSGEGASDDRATRRWSHEDQPPPNRRSGCLGKLRQSH